ncbi:hypothetical protein EMIT0210MI2_30016 [Priestia megaterium]
MHRIELLYHWLSLLVVSIYKIQFLYLFAHTFILYEDSQFHTNFKFL